MKLWKASLLAPPTSPGCTWSGSWPKGRGPGGHVAWEGLPHLEHFQSTGTAMQSKNPESAGFDLNIRPCSI